MNRPELMYLSRCALLSFVALTLPYLHAASPDPEKTRELLAVVQSHADVAARARALQQLALVATKDAVPPLAELLADEKLGQYARDVLENMPDPAAGDALRAALDRLQGNALVGVVNSLGMRRDEKAVEALGRLTGSNNLEVATPALLALGRIGSADALRTVQSAMQRGPDALRSAAAEAGLIAADDLVRKDRNAAALTLYEKIRRAELPLPLRVAATRGALFVPGNHRIGLLVEQLRSPELAMRDVALLTLRELRDAGITSGIVSELDNFPPEMQALLLAALADREEAAALPAVEQRAKAGNEAVRVAAVRALADLGRASSLPILLQAMVDGSSPAIREAARSSLARIPAPETNDVLQRALAAADATQRVSLIGILGERRAEAATGELMELAGSSDVEVSKAAFRALGLLARPDDMPRLIRLALTVSDEAAKSLADRAIVTTAMKILQPERRADAVLTAFRSETDPATRAALIRPLAATVRSMGGSYDAFAALRAALRDEAPAVSDAALKALAAWPDATPTSVLLQIANDEMAPRADRDLALAGAIRMAAEVAAGRERSPLNVASAFAEANRAVSTKAHKLMIVSGLGNLRRREAMELLQPYIDDPDVQTEAALAVLQIAPALLAGRESAPLKTMLEKIATREQDETVRKRATQLARGGPAQPAKQKAKGRKAAAAAAVANAGPGLFNGSDLGGWDGDPAVWRVRDGTLVGGSLDGNPRNEFLATTRRLRNFVLRLDYKLTGTDGFVNGGVQFRSVRVTNPPNEMSGYQADIGAGHSGSLYDESRRKKFLARANAELIKQIEKPGDWNTYEIRCEGPKVELTLNGRKTLTYVEEDPAVNLEGLIALQIHGNCKAEIAFRNLEVTELP